MTKLSEAPPKIRRYNINRIKHFIYDATLLLTLPFWLVLYLFTAKEVRFYED